MRLVILIAAFCLLITSAAFAQQPSPSPAAQEAAAQMTAGQDSAAPAPVPAPSEKALSYYRSGLVLWVVGILWGLLIPAIFLFTGFSARIRNWAQAIGRRWFFVIGVYFAIFLIINFVIDLPLSYYQGYVRQHDYGLSNQTLGKWFGDSLKGLMVGAVFGFLFLWIPYLMLKKSPRRWWLYTGLLAIPFLILVVLVQPIWIDPLFNKFGPMKNQELETRILSLADRAGIEGSRVFEVEKSEDTKALNAYVTGFGNTKRIVLWDNTIAKLSEEELLYVMGHEMGHYVLNHIWKTIHFFAILIMIALYAIHRTAGWLIAKYRHRFGFDELSDIASLPLIILLFSLYFMIITPIGLAYSRYNEHEADRFGLEITQKNRPAATAFVKLQMENLGVPRPHWLVKIWQASHPPLGERIDFCNEYRPWEKGEPLHYGELFKQSK
jgi:Zn-dependent protease with chaperone function